MQTETARDILMSLNLVRSIKGGAMTMIAGAPGVGKTHTLKHFAAKEGDDALLLTIAPNEGTPFSLAFSVIRLFSETQKANGSPLPGLRKLAAEMIGSRRVLIIDEGQYLTSEGAEWLRTMADDGRFDLVFCGDLALLSLINPIPQLNSRMRRPVVIKSVSRVDVATLVEGTAFTGSEVVTELLSVAQRKGGLRNVENVLRLAILFAGQDHPNLSHLKAAIIDMRLDHKGVKEWA